jgi:glycosyltransferase involved in cell wall biosynthesis
MYYLLWQLLAAREGRRLHRQIRFDVAHHVTFANVWLPALVSLVRVPLILGPVGGGPTVPIRLYGTLGVRGVMNELKLRFLRGVSRVNPLVLISTHRAARIVCQNAETREKLPPWLRRRAVIRPNASISAEEARSRRPAQPRPRGLNGQPTMRKALYAGRLEPWKGLNLAISAIKSLPDWQLTIVGGGSDAKRLRKLVERHALEARVFFRGWLPQHEVWSLLCDADALVLPSLREDASFIAVEAGALGVPVIAFDRGGPAALARTGIADLRLVPLTGLRPSVGAFASALAATGQARATDPVGAPMLSAPLSGERKVSEDTEAELLAWYASVTAKHGNGFQKAVPLHRSRP